MPAQPEDDVDSLFGSDTGEPGVPQPPFIETTVDGMATLFSPIDQKKLQLPKGFQWSLQPADEKQGAVLMCSDNKHKPRYVTQAMASSRAEEWVPPARADSEATPGEGRTTDADQPETGDKAGKNQESEKDEKTKTLEASTDTNDSTTPAVPPAPAPSAPSAPSAPEKTLPPAGAETSNVDKLDEAKSETDKVEKASKPIKGKHDAPVTKAKAPAAKKTAKGLPNEP